MNTTGALARYTAAVAVLLVLGIGLARADEAPRVVTISAKRFEFVPSQLTLKKGETVTLKVTSEDVKHGFFSRQLHIDADLTPGQSVEVPLTPAAAGTFTIICDHFCGAQHGNMKLMVVVE
jgi:cytochrome c oxidase subunit II